MSKLGMPFRIFTRNVKFWLMELAPLHSKFKVFKFVKMDFVNNFHFLKFAYILLSK